MLWIFFLLGYSPVSDFCVPKFRNTNIFTGRLNKKKTTTTNTCLCIRHLPNSGGTLRQSHATTDGRAVGRSVLRRPPTKLRVCLSRQKSPPLSVVHYLHIHIYMFRLRVCTHFSVLTTTLCTIVYTIYTRPTADSAVSHLALTVPPG